MNNREMKLFLQVRFEACFDLFLLNLILDSSEFFAYSEGGSPKRNSISPKSDKTANERRHPVSEGSEYQFSCTCWVLHTGKRWNNELVTY